MREDLLPVVIGVGQVVSHWDGDSSIGAPNPIALVQEAIEKAIADTGAVSLADHIDCAAFLRTFTDSVPRPYTPFGKVQNFPHAVLNGSSLNPDKVIYSAVGGDQPQSLINSLASDLQTGALEMAIIAGGEAVGALKTALKRGLQLDWADSSQGDLEDQRSSEPLLSRYEIQNGLGMPPQTYAALEQAWRSRVGLSTEEYRVLVGKVFARLSKTAAGNQYAQFPRERDSGFLSTPSCENYPICDPLLKWHVAQDAVNQASALLLTTAGKAREVGVPEDRWVYLHGCSDVKDQLVSEREDLSRSRAIDTALEEALLASQLTAGHIKYFDLYSCFPIVVMLAAEYLGVDPITTDVTVTGGLPFFGGPGNNYSSHAIASMVNVLRDDRDAYGLVLANGGFMSKESVGVYSARPPASALKHGGQAVRKNQISHSSITILDENCRATVEAYTVKHGKDGPVDAYVIARNAQGRVIARIDTGDPRSGMLLDSGDTLVGRDLNIEHHEGVNFVSLEEFHV